MTESLYRKYRPQTFADVVGQDAIVGEGSGLIAVVGQDAKVPQGARIGAGEQFGDD